MPKQSNQQKPVDWGSLPIKERSEYKALRAKEHRTDGEEERYQVLLGKKRTPLVKTNGKQSSTKEYFEDLGILDVITPNCRVYRTMEEVGAKINKWKSKNPGAQITKGHPLYGDMKWARRIAGLKANQGQSPMVPEATSTKEAA